MPPPVTAFLFGVLAGFLMLRLRRGRALQSWERKFLVPVGWVLMGASLALAAAIFTWILLGAPNP